MSRLVLAATALGLSALPAAAGCVGQCYRQSYVPPSYETVTEKVVVRAPRTYAVTTPAEYRTVQETVQVSPGGRHWSVSYDAYGNKVGCWVYTKPRYASVARTVMVKGPEVIPYAVPAQYGYRSHTVQTSAGYKTWTPVGSGGGYGYGGGFARAASYGGDEGYGAEYGRGSYGGGYGYGRRGGYGGRSGYGYGRGTGYGGGLVGGAVGTGAGIAGAGLDAGFGLAGGALDAVGF